MSTLDQMADEVLLNLTSYGLLQPQLTTLTDDLDTTQTTVSVTSATSVPVGLIEVGDELMSVQSRDTTANTLTVVRGYYTTAAAHTSGDRLTVSPPWPRKQVKEAINDAITSSYPSLFKVATTELTSAAADDTYTLAGAIRVLQVRALDIGPTTEWVRVNRFRYDPDLGKLTIYEGLIPGLSLHAVYMTTPARIGDGDDLTVSGLQASAKPYVVLAATAQLVLPMDGARLPSQSAASDDMEANRSVGSAVAIAKTLTARAEMELARERKRLQEKYPPSINLANRGR